MEKSLINPCQCRAYGISLCDDPTDPHRRMGIEGEFEAFIPPEMVRSTCGFVSRYPTEQEIETCGHVMLYDEDNWDPSKDHFNQYP